MTKRKKKSQVKYPVTVKFILEVDTENDEFDLDLIKSFTDAERNTFFANAILRAFEIGEIMEILNADSSYAFLSYDEQ